LIATIIYKKIRDILIAIAPFPCLELATTLTF